MTSPRSERLAGMLRMRCAQHDRDGECARGEEKQAPPRRFAPVRNDIRGISSLRGRRRTFGATLALLLP